MMGLVKHWPYRKLKARFGLFLGLAVIASTLVWSTLRQNQIQAAGADDFVTTWNSGSDGLVKIPILRAIAYSNATNYNFTVDWGDGSPLESFTGNATLPTHTYASLNTEYDIRINGVFAGWSFHTSQANITTAEATALPAKITKLKQWGTFAWKSVSYMFNGAKNMVSEATDIPNTSAVISFGNMFTGAEKFDAPILFDTSNGTNFAGMFMNAKSFNSSVSNMNTAKASSMYAMFYNAAKFNQSVSNFDTSRVTNAALMFAGATAFNQPVPFNTNNVTNMLSMFNNATNFNQPLTSFNTSKVVEMSSMFSGATSFNQPLTNFDTSRVGNMAGMFYRATAFNQPLNNFNTANVTNMTNMFAGATSFNQSLAGFNAERVINMGRMLEGATSFNSPLPYNTGNVTNMLAMLSQAASFNQPVNGLDTSKVQTFALMFSGATNFNQPVPFNTSSATDMSGMFQNASRFNQSLTSFDTSKVINMSNMFQGATAFNQPVNFNTQKVNNMAGMFSGTRVFNQPINFDTSGVTNFASMFQTARAFNQDLSHLNFSSATSFSNFMQQALSFSVKNYDKLLIAWKDQLLGNGKTYTNVYMQPIKYCVGEGARTQLRANGWSIYDGNARDCTSYGVDSIVFAGQTAVDENTATGTELGSLTANSQIPGDTFSYSLTCNVAGAQDGFVTLSGNRLSLAQVPNYEQNQALNICVRATNSLGTTRDQNFTFTVRDVNEAPTIGGVPTNSVNQDQSYSFLPTAGDPDTTAPNNTLTFAITNKPSWASFNPAIGALTGTPGNADVGNYDNIVISVSDGGGLTASLPAFNIVVNNVNDAPVISNQSFSVAENSANGTVVGQVVASDIDAGDTLNFAIVSGNNLNIFEITNTGSLKVRDNAPLDYETVTQVVLRVRVSDSGSPSLSAEANVTVNITDVNDAPAIAGTPANSVNQDVAYSFTPTVSDPDTTAPNNTLSLSISGKPSWANFNTTTGQLSGTPTNADVGVYNNIVITVTDGGGLTASLPAFNITVQNVNDAPVWTSASSLVINEDATTTHTLVATDIDAGDTLTYLADALPGWITLSGNQLTLKPAQAQVGSHTITVKVSDGTVEVPQTINITVNNVNDAPVFTSTPVVVATKGENYSYTAAASDEDGDTVAITVVAKPSWLNFDAVSGVLSGTPGETEVGNDYTVTLRAADGILTVDQTFTVRVNNKNYPPSITDQNFSVAENSVNGTVLGRIAATEPDAGQNLTYEIIGGNELEIFEVSASGDLRVKNNANLDYEQVRTIVLTIKITDDGAPSLSAAARMTVIVTDVDDEAPTITVSVVNLSEPISLTVGDSFTPPAAACQDAQGGCSLSVNNSVDVNTPGEYQVVYTATDSAGNQTVLRLRVVVKAKAVVPASSAIPATPAITAPRQSTSTISNQSTETSTTQGKQTSSAPFTLKGELEITLDLNEEYREPGFECAPGISCAVEIIGKVDTSRAGTYTITYRLAGSDYSVTRKVIVRGSNNTSPAATEEKLTWWNWFWGKFRNFWWLLIIIATLPWFFITWKRRRKKDEDEKLPPRRLR